MNMATALTSAALKSLSDENITASLSGTALALTEACERIKTRPLRSALKGAGFDCSKPIDGWSLPDAVWLAIVRRQPGLNSYPLGEIAERSVKKTLINLMLQEGTPNGFDARLNLGEREIQEHLRRSLKHLGHNGLLGLFLSQYFFETSIDYLRRPSGKVGSDWSYGYHFSKKNRMVSAKAEQKLRQTLNKQCKTLAAKFFPSSSKGKLKPESIEQRIRTGLGEQFGSQLAEVKKEPGRSKPSVNVILGTKSLAEIRRSYTVSTKAKRVLLHGKNPNIRFSLDVMEAWLGHSLHPLVKDLLEIGIAVHMSDLYTSRKRDLGRQIGIFMPVRNPTLWSAARAQVERTVASLGRDDFHIYFVKRQDGAGQARKFFLTNDERCVCLFSGGIDSVAGAAWALDHGMTPVFVSHHAISLLASKIQKPLVSQLEKTYSQELASFRITEVTLEKLKRGRVPKVVVEKLQLLKNRAFMKPEEFSSALRKKIGHSQTARYESLILKHARELQHISFFLNKSATRKGPHRLHKPSGGIMAQHLRSFLFLCVAATVALESGISTVYICENGPVALNPLFSEARVNTRTAHPHFLAYFQALIKTIFGVELRIENPFSYLTKGQVTGILARTELRDLLARTSSCWNWFKVRLRAKPEGHPRFKGNHDGDCLPCIHRRTAVNRADLWRSDARYLKDVFTDYPELSRDKKLGRDTKIAIADFLRFCENVISARDSEILLRAPDFSVYEEATDTKELIEMYREHAREVVRCFKTRSNKKFQDDFASVLGA